MIIIFDLDGTLADDTHRRHYLETNPKNWDAYFAACGGDGLVVPVAEVLANLQQHQIEIWTGRSETVRAQTSHWLASHYIRCYRLRMRPEGDFRPDTILKGEWLKELQEETRRKPDLVFDDRTSMVNWWRERGVTCFQVAQHDF